MRLMRYNGVTASVEQQREVYKQRRRREMAGRVASLTRRRRSAPKGPMTLYHVCV